MEASMVWSVVNPTAIFHSQPNDFILAEQEWGSGVNGGADVSLSTVADLWRECTQCKVTKKDDFDP